MRRQLKVFFATVAFVSIISIVPDMTGASTASAAEQTIGAKVGAPLKAAQDLVKAGKYADALKKVAEADAMSGKTDYENFVIDDFLLFLKVKLRDYAGAAKAGEVAFASGLVPAADRQQRLKALIQLNYQAKNYEKVAALAKQYRQQAGADADIELLALQAYYLQNDFADAQISAKTLVASTRSAGKKPAENILQLWLSSAARQKDRAGSRAALMELVSDYPSPAYWKNLLEVTASEVGRSDRMSYEIFRLKLATGALETSGDYTEMAQLAIQLGLPGEAESIMEKGFAAKVLGGANRSREERLLKMAKAQTVQDEPTLGDSAPTPKAKAALAEAYASYGKTGKAVALYREALADSFPEADLARLHLGQVMLAKGDAPGARKAFAAVRDAKVASIANLWAVIAR
ncbi:MAG TPA: hypothetical protein VGN05_01255 [Parvibaculum sp.]